MLKTPSKRRYMIVCGVLLFGYWSCVNPFAPRLEESLTRNDLITNQLTPDEVFQNFSSAYLFRDSLLYANILDSSFVFEFYDPNEAETGAFKSWGRDTELRTTGRLFRAIDTSELTWLNIIFRDQKNNGDEVVYRNFRLTLIGNEISATIQGYGIFTFRKAVDGKWRIKRWVDESEL